MSMTRAIEMKLLMDERVAKRNIVQKALIIRKQEGIDRVLQTEKHLKSMEIIMTSPKSLKRRT